MAATFATIRETIRIQLERKGHVRMMPLPKGEECQYHNRYLVGFLKEGITR